MTIFKYADLFCGAGGLSLGFRQAGYECVLAVDRDAAVVDTYSANFGDHVMQGEVSESLQLPDVDVIIGGPPCQGFSSAGLRRPDDRRNTLVRTFARIIAANRPRAFVFENVEGFLTCAEGKRILDLLEPVVEAGYRVHLRKINAANYGVPQHRKRVVAIGGLGFDPSFPEPTHRAFGAPGASKVYRHLPPCPTFFDATCDLPAPTAEPPGTPQGHFARAVSHEDAARIHLLKPGQRMKDLPESLWHSTYKKRAFRRVMDGTPTERRGGAPAGLRRLEGNAPSKTVTSAAISEFVHPVENRFLTLRECARLQTFPDWFVFAGKPTQVALQIGNAVPPVLAHAIASTLRQDLVVVRPLASSAGALLSFVVTLSTGMSPALAVATERVKERFGSGATQETEQLHLCL